MPADPSVSPADTPKNPGATIAEVLLLTEGYLDDGYGEADLRERMAKARPALDALLAVGERDKAEIAELRLMLKDAEADVDAGERDRQHIERLTAVVELVPSVGRLRWLAAILDAMDERGWPEGLTYTFDDGVSVPLLEYPDLDTPGDAVQRDLRALADARAVLADKEDADNG